MPRRRHDEVSRSYLPSGQRFPALGRHLVHHLFPELGGQLVALRPSPLDDGQNLGAEKGEKWKNNADSVLPFYSSCTGASDLSELAT